MPFAIAQNFKQIEEDEIITQRNFSIGSEWLYYKLYCGVKTADKLLTEIIKPITEEIIEKKWADKFFFIRYADPDLHIRLRIHSNNLTKIGSIISTVHQYLEPYMKQGLIFKIQTDTYRRELERYGNNTMELSEIFFHIDSIVTLNLLDTIYGEEGEQIRWQFALRSIDELLSSFHYAPGEKLLLLERLKREFINEHSSSKELKLQLDAKFRNLRKQVENILNKEIDSTREIISLIDLLAWKNRQLKPVADKIVELKNNNLLQVRVDDLMASYMHMMLNRIFKSRQRMYEMVIYDLLYRYYKSLLSREKNKNNLLIIEQV